MIQILSDTLVGNQLLHYLCVLLVIYLTKTAFVVAASFAFFMGQYEVISWIRFTTFTTDKRFILYALEHMFCIEEKAGIFQVFLAGVQILLKNKLLEQLGSQVMTEPNAADLWNRSEFWSLQFVDEMCKFERTWFKSWLR